MNRVSFILFVLAFFFRMVIIQIWQFPHVIVIPIELSLLLTALYFEKVRLPAFFIRFDKLKADLFLGLIIGTLYCTFESFIWGSLKGSTPDYRWDTLLVVPLGVFVAGWRAGVYEELLFRSFTMGYLNRLCGILPAIIGQAVLFWLGHIRHFQSESYWGVGPLILGLFCGWITYKRRSVIPGMIIHALTNSYGIAYMAPLEYLETALKSWQR